MVAVFTAHICNGQTNILANTAVVSFEKTPVWRLQVRTTTANVEDAGADGSVYIQLNDNDKVFKLDLGHDDRERKAVEAYDVISQNIVKIKDIQKLRIFTNSDDGWGIAKLEILVNNSVIFAKSFSPVKWLEKEGAQTPEIVFASAALRQHANWKLAGKPVTFFNPPTFLSAQTLEQMVESWFGDLTDHSDVDWGEKFGKGYVEAKRTNGNTVHFDLDMLYDLDGPFNPEVDIDFDLEFTCVNGKINTRVLNFKYEVGGNILESTLAAIANYFTGLDPVGRIHDLVENRLSFSIDLTDVIKTNCGSVSVNANGDLLIKGVVLKLKPGVTLKAPFN
jgi:hypothetical protein